MKRTIKRQLRESLNAAALKLDNHNDKLRTKIDDILYCLPPNVNVENVVGIEGSIWTFDLNTYLPMDSVSDSYFNSNVGLTPFMLLGAQNPKQALRETGVKIAHEICNSFAECLSERYTVVNCNMSGIKFIEFGNGRVEAPKMQFQIIVTFLTTEMINERVDKLLKTLLRS